MRRNRRNREWMQGWWEVAGRFFHVRSSFYDYNFERARGTVRIITAPLSNEVYYPTPEHVSTA